MIVSRFDTLLVRMVLLAAFSVIGCLAFVYLITVYQQDAARRKMISPPARIDRAIDYLTNAGWPSELSRQSMHDLQLDDYSVSEAPRFPVLNGPDKLSFPRLNEPGEGFGDGLSPRLPDQANPERPARFDDGPRLGKMRISVEADTGRWANLTFRNPRPPWQGYRFWTATLILALMVLIAAWSARNAIRPIRKMAQSATELAADFSYTPIEERGPSDVRQALGAFNRMGCRLESMVEGQRQLLDAIGHDLRTPITSLRLKIEMLSDPEERRKMERAIVELERITEAALVAAKAGRSGSPMQRLDLVSLVDSVCDDLQAVGMAVTCSLPEERPIILGQADGLVRALRNLIENGVQYGSRAAVSLSCDDQHAHIRVDDDGPGIPEADLDAVFGPLVRLERSRSRATGGHGLGLHIARSIIEAHAGKISLRNRAGGGLRAQVSLPLASA